jgi:tape measure domain-containing protein
MAGEGDAERLVVLLEARIRDFEKNMQKAGSTADRTFGRMRRDARSATRQMEADMARSTSRINQALAASSTRIGVYSKGMVASFAGAFAGAAVVRGAQQLIDANTRVTNSLKVAGLEGEGLKAVYQSLFVSAQKNAAPLESLATLYGRVALVQKELGVSTGDLLKFTDNVSLALRVAGTDATAASGALLQLSQAMGSGVVRAEEFNSILEGAQPIAQAAAAGLKEAGGSVAKLRQLVVDGKVSSEAFFAAFQAGSVILEEKVAGSELTTSQALIRLQNVLQDAAGKFDTATGASASFAGAVESVSNAIEQLQNSNILGWLGRLNNQLESSGFLQLRSSIREIEAILKFVDNAAGSVAVSFQGVADNANDAVAAALGFDAAASAPEALRGEIEKLAKSVVDGTTDADALRTELVRLGASPLNLAIQIGQIMDLARAAQTAAQSVATVATPTSDAWDASNRGGTAGTTPPKPKLKPVSLDDYDKPGGSKKGGRSKRSGVDMFADALRDQEQRIDALNRETAAQRSLNPLIDDYGYAMEKLRAQIDLENAATRAGLELTPDRQAAIDKLAEGYASASAEAEKLAEQQDRVLRSASDWAGITKDLASGFVNDLRNGVSVIETLGNAFDNLASKLIDMALDELITGLFKNLAGSIGGGLIGTGGLFANGAAFSGGNVVPFANGGVVSRPTVFPMSRGRTGLAGEAGPEAIMPLRRLPGGRLGVESSGGRGQGGDTATFAPSTIINIEGSADAKTLGALQEMIKQNNRQIWNEMPQRWAKARRDSTIPGL